MAFSALSRSSPSPLSPPPAAMSASPSPTAGPRQFHTSAQRAREQSPPSPETDRASRVPPRRRRSSRGSIGSLVTLSRSPVGRGLSASDMHRLQHGGNATRRSSMPLVLIPGLGDAVFPAAPDGADADETRWARRRSSDGAASVLEFHRASRLGSMYRGGHRGGSGSGGSRATPSEEGTPTCSPTARRASYTSILSLHTPVPSLDNSADLAAHDATTPTATGSPGFGPATLLGECGIGTQPGLAAAGAVPSSTQADAGADSTSTGTTADSGSARRSSAKTSAETGHRPAPHLGSTLNRAAAEQGGIETVETSAESNSMRDDGGCGGGSDSADDADGDSLSSSLPSAASSVSLSLSWQADALQWAATEAETLAGGEQPTAAEPDSRTAGATRGSREYANNKYTVLVPRDKGQVSPTADEEADAAAEGEAMPPLHRRLSNVEVVLTNDSDPEMLLAADADTDAALAHGHRDAIHALNSARNSAASAASTPCDVQEQSLSQRTRADTDAAAERHRVREDSESSGSSGGGTPGSVHQAQFFAARRAGDKERAAALAEGEHGQRTESPRRISLELPPRSSKGRGGDAAEALSSGLSSDSSMSSSLYEVPEYVCLRPATPGENAPAFRTMAMRDALTLAAMAGSPSGTSATAPASAITSPLSTIPDAVPWRAGTTDPGGGGDAAGASGSTGGGRFAQRMRGALRASQSMDSAPSAYSRAGYSAALNMASSPRSSSGSGLAWGGQDDSPSSRGGAAGAAGAAEEESGLGRRSWDADMVASSDESSAATSMPSSRRGSQRSVRDRWIHALRLYRAIRIFKRKSYPWVQLAGHSEGFKKDIDPSWILKLGNETERSILEMLQNEPVMAPFVPKFAGMVESDGKRYLKMQNLVALFPDANIMDIKMGLRTFVESEVNATALRKDLLKKMLDIDPEAASPAEVQNGITKMRYMQFRERQSSSYALGFRLEAMRVGNRANKGFKTLRARSDIVRNVEFFLDGHELVKRTFLDRLRKLRDALRASVFFHNHEMIGSSLLFLYDSVTKDAGVWMIDFAKTLEHDCKIYHDRPWQAGQNSFEDGYLTGLNKLIEVIEACKTVQERPAHSARAL